MSISIDDIVIPKNLIEMFAGSMDGVFLTVKALEGEGKKINDKLSAYKKSDTVQLKDNYKFQKDGQYEIDLIELSLDASKAPAIYSFKLNLKYKK